MLAGTALWPHLRSVSPFLAVCLLHIAGGWLLARATGLEDIHSLSGPDRLFGLSLLVALPIGLGVYFGHLGLVEREPRPLARVVSDCAALRGSLPALVWGRLLPLLLVPYLLASFSSVKAMIPEIVPFYLDPALADLDRWLHLGIDPWRITHALLPGAWASMAINLVYVLWAFAVWGFLLWQIALAPDGPNRSRFLLSFALCWLLLGSLGAILLSSAGPCYFGQVAPGGDPFAPLMNMLYAQDAALKDIFPAFGLWSLGTQELLWRVHAGDATMIGNGISAMPSMHVSMVVLMALAARRMSRRLGRIMTAFAVLTMIGSVHLGWHYALDGYVSGLATWGIWALAGRIARRPPAPAETASPHGAGRQSA